ncbi:MAG: hypothetical protein RLZZ205_115, partial [Bacteroidota bacterium]
KLDVKSKKLKIENQFHQWVDAGDADRKKQYGNALNTIKEYHSEWDGQVVLSTYAGLCLAGGAEFMGHAVELKGALTAYAKEMDKAKRAEMEKEILAGQEAFKKEYNAQVDEAVFVALVDLFRKNIDAAQHPEWMTTVLAKKYKNNTAKLAAQIFKTSMVMNDVYLKNFLAEPSEKALNKDLGIQIAAASAEFADGIRTKNPIGKFNKGYREFVAGYRKMETRQLAPDANSTMRVTYGKIKNYKAADALIYDYYTTTNGILEKWDNSNPEFVVPDKLVQLIKNKDFGQYANDKGELVTCFIGDLDITGGNSGSPVMDANGNWIGLAFDGNWEAMSGDIAYEKDLQRTICVDIRYVLFVVEKLMGGKNIVDELTYYHTPTVEEKMLEMPPKVEPELQPAPAAAPKKDPKKKK